jgi:muconolactone delta-isomerase
VEFLVEFDIHIPDGTAESEVAQRNSAEAAAADGLSRQGHLVRLWRTETPGNAIGLYRADSQTELERLLDALPLNAWMQVTVTPVESHPNDPTRTRDSMFSLPSPRLSPLYRLEATLGEPVDVGDITYGHRRMVPLTGGTFAGPQISGTLVPGVSADWQTILPDGTALGDIRYTLRTHGGDSLYVQSRSVRHGPADVLNRLARGEDVDPGEYTFRAATQIEAAAPELDWLNKGIFVSVGGRRATSVIYETYLVE